MFTLTALSIIHKIFINYILIRFRKQIIIQVDGIINYPIINYQLISYKLNF